MNKAHVFWFTGLSGSGKTTIAEAVAERIKTSGLKVLLLDGDKMRDSHTRLLGFAPEDIEENNMIIAKTCLRYEKEFDVILVPVISPLESVRQKVKVKIGPHFWIIYFSAKLETVVKRDIKGLYAKAQSGVINNMIGFSKQGDQFVAPYEKPTTPDLDINSDSGPDRMEANISKLEKFIIKKVQG